MQTAKRGERRVPKVNTFDLAFGCIYTNPDCSGVY